MKIGIPTEVKVLEGRVGLIPAAAGALVKHGHQVFIQSGAGILSGFPDESYRHLGVTIVPDAVSLYSAAEMVVKVKEPQPEEVALLRSDHVLFSYLHLAAVPTLARELRDIGLTAVAFETVEDNHGLLPLLAPMSEIAGRIAVQVGCHYLHRPMGGKGIMLGGLSATERGHVVVIGGGVAGTAATALAAAMGAHVTVFDLSRSRLDSLRALGHNVTALYPYEDQIHQAALSADLLIGAVLLPGQKAPNLVHSSTVKAMQAGSVIVDISVDQGGCIETIYPTSYEDPVYRWNGVLHFGVTNMPGAVPETASQALSAAIMPYVQSLALDSWETHLGLAKGVNVRNGKLVHPGLCASLPELCE